MVTFTGELLNEIIFCTVFLICLSWRQESFFLPLQARRNEKNSKGEGGGGRGEATNYEILLATMVGRRRKFPISNRLKRLEKLHICRRQVMYIFAISQSLQMLAVFGGLKFRFEVSNVFDYRS